MNEWTNDQAWALVTKHLGAASCESTQEVCQGSWGRGRRAPQSCRGPEVQSTATAWAWGPGGLGAMDGHIWSLTLWVPSSWVGKQSGDEGSPYPTPPGPASLEGLWEQAGAGPARPRAPLPARRRASSGRGRQRRAGRSCRPGRAGARRRRSPSRGTGPGAGGPPGRRGTAGRPRCASAGSRCCGAGGAEGDWLLQPGAQIQKRGRPLAPIPAPFRLRRPSRSPVGSRRLRTAKGTSLGEGKGAAKQPASSAHSPSSCAPRGLASRGRLMLG